MSVASRSASRFAWAVVVVAAAAVVAVSTGDRPDARAQSSAEVQRERPFGAPIRFRHLGLDDGLPNPYVQAIWQDSLGFLWVGTYNGLARYDGAEVRTYRPTPFDTTSLSDAWVVAIAGTTDGDVWVLNENGPVNRYDPRRDAFSLAPADSAITGGSELLVGRDGTVWAGHFSGLYRHDPARRTAERVRPDVLDGDVTALAEATSGTLWVGTRDVGVVRLEPDGAATSFRYDPADPSSLPSDFVGALLVDRAGRLWVGTGRGLAVSVAGDRFETVDGLRGEAVWSLAEDPAGDVWVGTSDGLVRLDPPTGRTSRYAHDPADPSSVGAGAVRALFLDRAGTLWAGTETGLSAFVWSAPPFDHLGPGPDGLGDPGVWAIVEARDGTLWVGTRNGVDGFALDGAVRRFRSDGTAATIGPGSVTALYEEPDGTLLVGTRPHLGRPGGFTRLDPATGRVVRQFDRERDGLPTDYPWSIWPDRRGRIWVMSGSNGCPSVFDSATSTFEAHCPGNDPDRQLDAKVFFEDDAGDLWFGAWGAGLVRLDLKTGETRQISHDPADPNTPPNNIVESFAHGPDGSFWFGTYGAGLSLFDPAAGTFRHLHSGNSDLPSDLIYAIESDDGGHLWMSTDVGLTRFDPLAETFETFGLDDGLQGLDFNGGVSHRGADGMLYFGGVNGLNRFDPARIGSGRTPPAAVVTAVAVAGERVAPGDGSALAVAAPYAETVRLGARQRDVAFTVAAPGAAGSVRYRVRLDGYDDDWHPPGPQRTAAYTNLDPGRYTFRVQAATGPTWGDAERALAVVVTPRWFQTWWSRLLAGLAVVGGVGWVLRSRARAARQRQAELEGLVTERTVALRERTLALEAEQQTTRAQAERLREVDRLRTRFFTNVSHEFRTPLTLTIGPLEDLDAHADALPEDARWSVDVALRNSRRLLRLTNQLLDAARLEAGEMRLRARPLDLGAHVRATALSFAPLAERRRVRFDVETPPEPVPAWADPDKLDAVLVNLLSNAFKFTPEGGAVRVAVVVRDEAVEVHVRDNGPGIAEADLPHVFDRFYRVEETEGTEGTGIGLSLARDLAALHGGGLSAESVAGLGSLFTLTLPLGRGHLRDDQVTLPAPEPSAATVGVALPDAEPPAAPEDAGDDRTTILVADDNADIRAYVRSHLGDRYRVIEAPDGDRALALAQEETPDLVVSDLMMPGLDGIGLVRALRADPATDFIPVILLTAKAEEVDVQTGLDAGADDYVVKPFNVQTLQARIDNLIASRRWLRDRFATATGDGARSPAEVAAPPETSPFVGRARAAVEGRLGDEELSVEDLASALDVSRSTLHRRLTADGDATPTAFIRHVRLEHGRDLLRASSGTVSEVAYAVGFRSVSHFSRSFRQRYGVPPSAEIGLGAGGAEADGVASPLPVSS